MTSQRSGEFETPSFETPSREKIVAISAKHVAMMETSDADDTWIWVGMEHLLLHTVGRRTGNVHKVALPFWLDRDGHRVVVASFAGAPTDPAWFLNLSDRTANPEVLVRVQGGQFWATAQVLDGEDYDATWAALVEDRPHYADYTTKTTRRIPLVRLPEPAIDDLSWYHTMELPGGVVTRGQYDLRGLAAAVLPTDLAGKRCLDACSATGFWAFEMEKRGAKDVVAIDIRSYRDKDWRMPWLAPDREEAQGGTFRVAKAALGSSVHRQEMSVYDVTAGTLGTFDFVFIGSVLLHLRDPVRALRALRDVTGGELVSFEPILLLSSLMHPRSPRGRMAAGADARWWTPNAAAHAAWVAAGGFEVVERSWHRQPFGDLMPRTPRRLPRLNTESLTFWLGTRHFGLPSQRLRARPLAP